jgi:hypothetical protein
LEILLNILLKFEDLGLTSFGSRDGYPSGMVFIKISPLSEKAGNGDMDLRFKADIVASVAFPKQDGA